MKRSIGFLLPLAGLMLSIISCGQAGRPTITPTVLPPTPAPPMPTLPELPVESDLRDLITYANAMGPYMTQAGAILVRDGEILQEAEAGNDDVLCDGRLALDNAEMRAVLDGIQAIEAPSEATAIHDLVLRSGQSWTEALDNVELFCNTGNALYKIPAIAKYWEAAVSIQDAGNRFWLLVVSQGIEDWVQR